MTEEIVKIGKDGHMVGVLSVRDASERKPVALMFNAGFIHRVGPFRMWVDLARELAKENIPSLRFDLNGIGDSALTSDACEDPEKRAIESIIEAMDYVENRMGKREFIIFGLCSGADYGYPAAKVDPRIRGVTLIDGFGYKTKGFLFHRHFSRLRRLFRSYTIRRVWMKLVQLVRQMTGLEEGVGNALAEDLINRPFPDQKQVQADILSFLDEGRRLYCVYSGGVPYFNHEGQFWNMFPGLRLHRQNPGLSYDFFGKCDHTFSLIADRKVLIGRLVDFVLSFYPRGEVN